MKILFFIDVLILSLASSFSVYLFILAVFGIRVKRCPASITYKRFAILIPAHNEAENIEIMLNPLRETDYPKELFDCYFVADHCTDMTAAKIIGRGFKCYEKNDGSIGKGRALGWLIDKVLGEGESRYDAFIFLDADNIISRDFLKLMNDNINKGNDIIQGFTDVTGWDRSVFAIVNYINYITINRFRENARSNIGLSSRLHGHGMCFKTDILKRYIWSTDSCVEDRDLFLQIVLDGKRIVWEHNAHVYSILPNDTHNSTKQRIRWSRAKNKEIFGSVWLLIKKLFKKFDMVTFDTLIEIITPPNANLIGIILIGWALSLALISISISLFWWASALTALYLAYFLTGAMLERLPVRFIIYFLLSPVFIFWRMWIFLLSFRKVKAQEWR